MAFDRTKPMKLIDVTTRKSIKIGDIVESHLGEKYELIGFDFPHKSSAQGRVFLKEVNFGYESRYYASVINAEYVNVL